MKEILIAAIAAISVPTGAESGGWPVNPRKTSLENKNSIVIAYSHFNSHSQFRIIDDQYSYEKNGLYFSHYICGTNNSLNNDMIVVV